MTPSSLKNQIALTATCSSLVAKAQELAAHLQLPFIYPNQTTSFALLLIVTPTRLELRENNLKNAKPIFVDFLAPAINYRTKHGGGKHQLIAKAVGLKKKKNPVIIDATAGFGIDAFILASLGCKVTMLERSPIIYALLKDGLERLHKASNLTLSLNLNHTQADTYLKERIAPAGARPDIIYLDPMYPHRAKAALNKKSMRLLHNIVGNDADARELLPLALQYVKNRVVVKRPKLAGYLGEEPPNLQFFSQGSSRYDIYFP